MILSSREVFSLRIFFIYFHNNLLTCDDPPKFSRTLPQTHLNHQTPKRTTKHLASLTLHPLSTNPMILTHHRQYPSPFPLSDPSLPPIKFHNEGTAKHKVNPSVSVKQGVTGETQASSTTDRVCSVWSRRQVK